MDDKRNEHARELSKLGSSKGGKARASVLTPEERSEISRRAVRTRWAKAKGLEPNGGQILESPDQWLEQVSEPKTRAQPYPISLFQGTLDIEKLSFSCHVLNTGQRVIVQREVVGLLTGNVKGGLSRYLTTSALSKYLDVNDITRKTIEFAIPATQLKAIGYEATLLIEICEAYLKAREENALASNQQNLAKRAEIIMRACAKVGIIALIDEATGYQEIRAKNALQLKLQAFIAEEMQEWARMFPEDFWIELARLENVHYSPRTRPIRWGKYVMAFVYDAVDKDVGRELRKINPDPHFGQNHHQWLKQYGREKVRDHLNQVLGVMKLCRDMNDFNSKFGYVFKKSPLQLTFFDLVDTMA